MQEEENFINSLRDIREDTFLFQGHNDTKHLGNKQKNGS